MRIKQAIQTIILVSITTVTVLSNRFCVLCYSHTPGPGECFGESAVVGAHDDPGAHPYDVVVLCDPPSMVF